MNTTLRAVSGLGCTACELDHLTYMHVSARAWTNQPQLNDRVVGSAFNNEQTSENCDLSTPHHILKPADLHREPCANCQARIHDAAGAAAEVTV